MRQLFISALVFISLGVFAQEPINNESNEIVGVFTQDNLMVTPYSIWFEKKYQYKTNTEIISELKKLNNNYNVLIILGTWCSDSQEQVPRFIKILDEISFDKESLLLVGVNHDKKVDNFNIEKYNLERVPTFIILRDNQEIGRITETPIKTLEEDLLKILTD